MTTPPTHIQHTRTYAHTCTCISTSNTHTLTCVPPQQRSDFTLDGAWSVDRNTYLCQRLLLLKEVMVHVEQRQLPFRDELSVVRGELRKEVVEVEVPYV